jgi:hypothetical protein
LNFATVVERMTFDQLDIDYKMKEKELCEAYMESFENIKKDMRKVNKEESTFDISNNNNEDNQQHRSLHNYAATYLRL